jgi:hypothetical protein
MHTGCTLKYFWTYSEGNEGGKIKKNEMGWACGTNGGGKKCAQGFGGEA